MTPIAGTLNIAAHDGRITGEEAKAELKNIAAFSPMGRAALKSYYETVEYQRGRDTFEPGARELITEALRPQLKASDAKGPNLWDRTRAFFGHARDTDRDGVSDIDEMKQHTNRFVADTDGDGRLDGADSTPGAAY